MKYIIEFEDEPVMHEAGEKYHQCKQVPYWSLSHDIINKLTPYTEPDRKVIEDEVWDFASMLMNMHHDVAEDIYWSMNGGKGIEVAAEMTYQEAKSKYEAWQKEKDKICVGDEVKITEGGSLCVVSQIVGGTADLIFEDGGLGQFPVDKLIRTDRHFPEVEELLKKMRG